MNDARPRRRSHQPRQRRRRGVWPCRRPPVALAALVAALVASWSPPRVVPRFWGEAARASDGGAATGMPPAIDRRPGPAGSLLIVESVRALPMVHVVVAVRSGSAWDPRQKDGLANLTAAVARRGAAGRARVAMDARIDALGATLEVHTDPDSTRLEGHVLSRYLDDYLAILADIVLRPDFTADEIARTRREILADIDEARNDDRALCQRFFVRNLYGDHPYGHDSEGDRASMQRIRREDLLAFHRVHVVGPNLIFAATGDVAADDFARRMDRWFTGLPKTAAPGPNPLAVREPQPATGWRVQIVDKPERQQAQILFGHLGVRATDPDYVPLLVAITSFGGRAMQSTLMDEVRTKRALAYGAYMSLSERQGRGAAEGWVFSGIDKAVPTLKLVLRLYVALMEHGIPDDRLTFIKAFLAGTHASEMDDPEHRLDARVSAEIVGLSAAFVDELPDRVRAVTAAEVRAAVTRHVRARDLAITVVATGAALRQRLIDAKVQPSAIDLVPYDGY